MKIDNPGRFAMLRRTLLELPRGELQVGCSSGSLWLTLDHDARDIVLEAGQRISLDGARRVLAYALEDAVLEVMPSRAPAPARGSAWLRPALQPA
jgi:Protein of unknown function (DUF2917)